MAWFGTREHVCQKVALSTSRGRASGDERLRVCAQGARAYVPMRVTLSLIWCRKRLHLLSTHGDCKIKIFSSPLKIIKTQSQFPLRAFIQKTNSVSRTIRLPPAFLRCSNLRSRRPRVSRAKIASAKARCKIPARL